MKRIISPSLLSADFSHLREQIKLLEDLEVNRFHLDPMDGHFVPNFTYGPFIVDAIRKLTDAHLEAHLMIEKPHKYIDDFINAGSDTVIVHAEASIDISHDLNEIREKGAKAGIALNPDTDVSCIKPILNDLDYILIMSIFPGFPAQKFIKSSIEQMKNAVELRGNRDIVIGVDGGVNLNTIRRVFNTGIDIAIVGSALYKAPDVPKRYYELLNA